MKPSGTRKKTRYQTHAGRARANSGARRRQRLEGGSVAVAAVTRRSAPRRRLDLVVDVDLTFLGVELLARQRAHLGRREEHDLLVLHVGDLVLHTFHAWVVAVVQRVGGGVVGVEDEV